MGTQHPLPKGGTAPNVRPMSIVAKRLDGLRRWYGGKPWPRRHCARCGPSSRPKNKRRSPHPNFGPCLLWPNVWMDQDATFYGGRPLPRPHCARWGPSPFLPHTQKRHSPQFSAHVCCGQPAGLIKMPLSTKVGLGPGHIVLHGDPAHPPKGHSPQLSAHVYCGQTVAHLNYC